MPEVVAGRQLVVVAHAKSDLARQSAKHRAMHAGLEGATGCRDRPVLCFARKRERVERSLVVGRSGRRIAIAPIVAVRPPKA